MGRLFWKFFFFFWMAQVVSSLGVGFAFWIERGERLREPPPMMSPPAPRAGESPDRNAGGPPPRGADFRPDHFPLARPLTPILAGSVVSILFAALLAWYFSKPIRSLQRAFGAVAEGKLGTRIGKSMALRRDELADLGHDFDLMAERMQQLIESQRRLLHDVSHELRSPLARLQAASDLIRQQPERAAEYVARIERDTGRVDRLVGELLTLARLDNGMAGNLDEEIDLDAALHLIAEDAEIEAQAKNCVIDLRVTAAPVLRGNYDLICRAVENVVRNALRHSPPGGRIEIAASADAKAGGVRISVADEGSGVLSVNLERIFEPFFREGSAQSSDGYGLGLPITRRIVQSHGGRVTAANRPTGGLEVTLWFPLETPAKN